MIFRQITHEDLGCASYLVGDAAAHVAAVIDPRLAIEGYLELADYLEVRIEHVLETHNHADHVSGHGRLAAAGATIHVHRLANVDYPHEPIEDGWSLTLGSVRIEALHTPGHRPEHTAFLLADEARGPEPWAVLTGDSLFVGDVARPDLAIEREQGAREIFHSLHARLLTLPAQTEVWPAHLGGSLCGGPGMDLKICSTIAYEQRYNDLLREHDEDAFASRLISGLGPQPPNFKRIVELNRRPFRAAEATPPSLPAHDVQRERAAGATVVDVRSDSSYDQGHVPCSLCLPIAHAGFGTKLAWLAAPDRPLVLVGRDEQHALEGVELAAAVGIFNIAGVLAGGVESWMREGHALRRIRPITVAELHEHWHAGAGAQILDVRERAEWDAGHIPGSVGVPYHDVERWPDQLDAERPLAVICSSGQRSAAALGALERLGAETLLHVVDGGVETWEQLGYPIEASR